MAPPEQRMWKSWIIIECSARKSREHKHGKAQDGKAETGDTWRTPAGRVPDPDGTDAISVGEGDRRAGAADRPDRGGEARHHGGDRPSAVPFPGAVQRLLSART